MTEFLKLSMLQCREFLADTSRNPLTGRRLTSDAPGSTKSKLVQYCHSLLQSSAKSSTCLHKAPWMGPIIHPEHIDYGKYALPQRERYNLQLHDWCKHLHTRMPQIIASESYSMMELDDLLKSLTYVIKGAHDSEYLVEGKKYIIQLRKLRKSDKVYDDYQEFDTKNWHSFELKKDRYHLRQFVAVIEAKISRAIREMKNRLTNPQALVGQLDEVTILIYLRYEEFLDLLINKCYFREEDIFGQLFPEGRKVFKILKDTYKKYSKL